MTISNWLTLIRVLLIPVFMAFLLADVAGGPIVAAIVFGAAAATDGVDGWLARRRREQTAIGEVLDPFADKLLVSAALVSLVQLGKLSSWIAMIIIAREFLVSALRLIALGRGVQILPSPLGKTKTTTQIIAIIVWIATPVHELSGGGAIAWAANVLLAIALIFTVVSGYGYMKQTLPLFGEERE